MLRRDRVQTPALAEAGVATIPDGGRDGWETNFVVEEAAVVVVVVVVEEEEEEEEEEEAPLGCAPFFPDSR